MEEIPFDIGPQSPAPGARHGGIGEALKASAETGTRSILDIAAIADQPNYGVACPLGDDVLLELFGTTTPTTDQAAANTDFFDRLDRGQAIYIILHEEGKPSEVMFAGYSFD